MSTTDELIENSKRYADSFDKGNLALPPAKKVAVRPMWTKLVTPGRWLSSLQNQHRPLTGLSGGSHGSDEPHKLRHDSLVGVLLEVVAGVVELRGLCVGEGVEPEGV